MKQRLNGFNGLNGCCYERFYRFERLKRFKLFLNGTGLCGGFRSWVVGSQEKEQ